jgi:glyoxylase-like metal-dependent hydrolase (beta-lactamase superfamily II)/ferredoxin
MTESHPENVPGDWFVDRRCIGCGSSWSVAPDLIGPTSDGRFAVFSQPSDPEAVLRAELAAEVCPTGSVRTRSRHRWARHHPLEVAPGVLRLGTASVDSAGGQSFLVRRPGGNLLVDGPRWSPRLVREIAGHGGVAHVLLTHRDDVADAERYAREFGADVTIHAADADAAPSADHVLSTDEVTWLTDDVLAIPTPGHTAGHVMFLLCDGTLFSGDSLSWEPARNGPWAEQAVCWWSWTAQLDSLERLLGHPYTQVVPTHGMVGPRLQADEQHDRLRELLTQLRAP